MISATEELRRLLDERGVEWWPSDERWNADVITHWYAGLLKWTAIEGEDGLWVNAGVAGHNSLTPEQAIAATLGAGTCRITDNGPWGYPYVCSECGASFDPDVNNGEFNYCPNCGRRIEVDDG